MLKCFSNNNNETLAYSQQKWFLIITRFESCVKSKLSKSQNSKWNPQPLSCQHEETYTICGVLESEPDIGLISVHSPIAKGMLGKSLDDEFKIRLPKGMKEYEILSIEYKNIFSLKQKIRTKADFSFH